METRILMKNIRMILVIHMGRDKNTIKDKIMNMSIHMMMDMHAVLKLYKVECSTYPKDIVVLSTKMMAINQEY